MYILAYKANLRYSEHQLLRLSPSLSDKLLPKSLSTSPSDSMQP